MASQIQFRKGTAASWTSANPTLSSGEVGAETDTQKFKIGDGSTAWTSLAYQGFSPDLKMMVLATQTEPSAPSSGTAKFYTNAVANRNTFKWKGPAGIETHGHPALYERNTISYTPSTTTGVNAFGAATLLTVGTVSHPTLTTTSLRTASNRWIITSAATATSAAEHRLSVVKLFRGASGKLGGFFVCIRFATSTTVTNQQCFIGLMSTTTATSTSAVPSALSNVIGVGWDSADTALHLISGNASTTTKTSLGSNFPSNDTSAVYELSLYCEPAASVVNYRVERLDSAFNATGVFPDSQLPGAGTGLTPHIYMNNGGTASAVVLECMKIYMETPL